MAEANSLDYASIFQSALDEQMVAEMTSSRMEANASQVQYNGGNEIKVLKMTLEGLGDYDRATGFDQGAITTSWETHSFDKDRGKEFNVDSQDNDESFVDVAGAVMGEFQRVHVAPEVDAYRYSKIWDRALSVDQVGRYAPASATIFEQLSSDISDIQDSIGETEPLTIYMSFDAAKVLDQADKIEKRLDVSQNADGTINSKVKTLDGIPIVRVPAVRFKTEYDFSATDGFSAGSLAAPINWIIAANRACIGIVKTDKVRTFSPDVNQDLDAWKMQYRKYHTLIIPDRKLDGVYVNYTGIDAPELTATVATGSESGTTKFTATADSGNTLGYILGDSSPGVKYLDLIDSYDGSVEPYTSGDDITASADQILTMCEVNGNGRIVKVKEVTLTSGDIAA